MLENDPEIDKQIRSTDSVILDRMTAESMARSYAIQAGFHLFQNGDGTFNLVRRVGADGSRKTCLTFFAGATLEGAITICNNAEADTWHEVDELLSDLRDRGEIVARDEAGEYTPDELMTINELWAGYPIPTEKVSYELDLNPVFRREIASLAKEFNANPTEDAMKARIVKALIGKPALREKMVQHGIIFAVEEEA
jgi:hypothetical protein